MTSICLGEVDTAIRFQLRGRLAAADMRLIRSIRSAGNRPTAGMNSSEVPSNSEQTRDSSTISCSEAWREGTGWPFGSLWVVAQLDEKPMPPSDSDVRSSSCMAASSSGVAS